RRIRRRWRGSNGLVCAPAIRCRSDGFSPCGRRIAMAEILPSRPLAPFGVELMCDLAAPFSPAQEDRFRDLFNTHGLILARGQSLSMARQREICGLLGPI